MIALLHSSPELQTLVLQRPETQSISSINNEEVYLHISSCKEVILLLRFPHYPCRLWAHGVCSMFFNRNVRCDSGIYGCQHLPSGWMPVTYSWRHFQWLVLYHLVRADDFLWSFTHLRRGHMFRFPSVVPCLQWVWLLYGAQVGMFPLSYLKLYKHQTCQIINLGNCILLE